MTGGGQQAGIAARPVPGVRPRRGARVRTRLALLTVVLSGLVLVGGAVASIGMARARDAVQRQTMVAAPALDAARDLRNVMSSAESSLRGYLVVRASGGSGAGAQSLTPEGFLDPYDTAETAYPLQLDRVDERLASVLEGMSGATAQRLAVLGEQQREEGDAWWALARQARDGAVSAAQVAAADQAMSRFLATNDALSEMLAEQRTEAAATVDVSIVETERRTVTATVTAALLAALWGLWTTRDLTRPLAALRDTAMAQRSGVRTAWADPTAGAREVRELAAAVNALTVSQQQLLDEESYALELSQSAREIGRSIQDASDPEAAFLTAVRGVVAALEVDDAYVVVTRPVRPAVGWAAVWSPRLGAAEPRSLEAEETGRLHAEVARLWDGERVVVVDDLAGGAVLPAPEGLAPASGTAQVAAIGVADKPRGVLVVRSADVARVWTPAERGFVAAVAGELGRAVEAAEIELARVEQVRRLEELDAQKDGFLATVSHELRTPLTSIAGYLELLQEGAAGELTEGQERMLAVVERNTVRLRALIEDLLLINRMRDGVADEVAPVDVDVLVAAAVAEVHPLAEARGVTVLADAASGARVPGNAAQLERVVGNLLSNAVKFTESGGTVRVGTTLADAGRTVRIVCADEGMGIPEEEQPRLFTRFFRASNAVAAEMQGTGLGLAVVKGIVEAHGGRVALTSAPGAGTTVTVELPAGSQGSDDISSAR